MDVLRELIDLVLHLDRHLAPIAAAYGGWIYGLLFLIIFAETGLVVTPILPGDSLLFAAGALAATGALHVGALLVLLSVAAIAGDSVNYWIGSYVGTHVFRDDARVLKRAYLERTERFYARYGGKTIVLARFVPIVRTYAPFVAGACGMNYRRFLTYNVLGGLLWIGLLTMAGYLFGNIPVVKNNFGLVIIGIIILSVLPAVFEVVSARRGRGRKGDPAGRVEEVVGR